MKLDPFGRGTRTYYYVQVAFTLLTIAVSAYLNRQLLISERSNRVHRDRFAASLAAIDDAGQAAGAVHGPANDTYLRQGDPVRELSERNAAAAQFHEVLKTVRANARGEQAVLDAVQAAERHMTLMLARSDEVFRLFDTDNVNAAAALLAMDQEYSALRRRLDFASVLTRNKEDVAYPQRTLQSRRLAGRQTISLVLLAVLVIGLVAFGRRLHDEAVTTRERDQYVRTLKQREDELRRALAERDARADELSHNQQILLEAERLARIGAWEFVLASQQVSWSEGLYRIYGLDPEQFKPSYEAFMSRVHPADQARIGERIGQALEDLQPFEFEHRILLPSGEVGVNRSVGRVETDSQGRPVRMYGVASDVTERNRAEELLLSQEAQLAEAQRIARVGSWELNVTTGQVSWSDELHEILGYSSAEATPSFKAYMSLIEVDERRRVYGLLQNAMEQGNDFEFEHSLLRRDGAEIMLLVEGLITRDEKGRPVRVVGISQDITERKKSEKTLRLSEERFQLVSRATNDVIWDWDLVTNNVWVNESFASRFGYPTWGDIAVGLWKDAIHPEEADRVLASLHEALQGSASFWTAEYRFRTAGGTWKEVMDRRFIVRDSSGKAVRIIGAMMDISEQRAIDRMKDEFISTVSHELRTPLTSIRGALGLLASGRLGALEERGQRLLDIASTNTDRLVRLINDILDIERIESGKVTLTKTSCDAAVLARSAADLVRGLAERENITITVYAEPTPMVADADRVIQTLTNLLGNAVKFSPADSTVLLSVAAEGQNVLFSVIDRGRGIPVEKLGTIFERFQQVDASDSRDKGGSGLGLTISRSIVRQHGGEIRVDSTVGRGTTFTVSIPGRLNVPIVTATADKMVYICDDDSDTRDILQFFLTKRGYRIKDISSGPELLRAVASERPDAILLDLFMPELNGWETLAKLKGDPETADIPVIIVSVLSQHEVGATSLDLSGWVQKPLDERVLAEVVDHAFRGSKRPARLMLVEDDEDLAAIIIESLHRYGIDTIHARTGQEAIALAGTADPDLLILDIGLPGVDGYGVVEWLKDHSLWRSLPLVVYSATEPSPSEKERLRLGHTEFMTKSRVTPADFEKTIVGLLDTLTAGREGHIQHVP